MVGTHYVYLITRGSICEYRTSHHWRIRGIPNVLKIVLTYVIKLFDSRLMPVMLSSHPTPMPD
jgi:hypothetical protein